VSASVRPVAALFVQARSVYRSLGVECFDLARDARTFGFDMPVIAHPPCRAWGRFAHVAKPREDEKELALFAVDAVRRCGGVLEHPISSRLWQKIGVRAGHRDSFGGLLLPVDQCWWGHRAQKRTGLYLVGTSLVPPLSFDAPFTTVERMGKRERMATPPALALDLVNAARGVRL
jgi:hypothetical protein